MTVAGLLLAAGAGTRLGGPKALVEIGGQLLIEQGARLLHDGGCDPIVVVVGAAADEVVERADLARAHVVVNPEWATGMRVVAADRHRRAARRLPGRRRRARRPAARAPGGSRPVGGRVARGAVAAVAQWHGRPGTPVLLDAVLLARVRSEAVGDVGARRFLRRHPQLVTRVPCDGAGSPDDIDTADLDRVARVMTGKDVAQPGLDTQEMVPWS